MKEIKAILKQDKDVLEEIQATSDQDRWGSAQEVLVASDRAMVGARRILQKMLEAEF